jgi:hypothetical protein
MVNKVSQGNEATVLDPNSKHILYCCVLFCCLFMSSIKLPRSYAGPPCARSTGIALCSY